MHASLHRLPSVSEQSGAFLLHVDFAHTPLKMALVNDRKQRLLSPSVEQQQKDEQNGEVPQDKKQETVDGSRGVKEAESTASLKGSKDAPHPSQRIPSATEKTDGRGENQKKEADAPKVGEDDGGEDDESNSPVVRAALDVLELDELATSAISWADTIGRLADVVLVPVLSKELRITSSEERGQEASPGGSSRDRAAHSGQILKNEEVSSKDGSRRDTVLNGARPEGNTGETQAEHRKVFFEVSLSDELQMMLKAMNRAAREQIQKETKEEAAAVEKAGGEKGEKAGKGDGTPDRSAEVLVESQEGGEVRRGRATHEKEGEEEGKKNAGERNEKDETLLPRHLIILLVVRRKPQRSRSIQTSLSPFRVVLVFICPCSSFRIRLFRLRACISMYTCSVLGGLSMGVRLSHVIL